MIGCVLLLVYHQSRGGTASCVLQTEGALFGCLPMIDDCFSQLVISHAWLHG